MGGGAIPLPHKAKGFMRKPLATTYKKSFNPKGVRPKNALQPTTEFDENQHVAERTAVESVKDHPKFKKIVGSIKSDLEQHQARAKKIASGLMKK